MTGPLLLCDSPGLLYRGFFSVPDSVKGAEGRPVNALLGSVNQALWCVEKYQPRSVVMCFGQESADYRVEAFPDYHAARPEMPDELAWQWERAPELYRALGWLVESHEALEADELLALLPATDRAGAERAAERLKQAVDGAPVQLGAAHWVGDTAFDLLARAQPRA